MTARSRRRNQVLQVPMSPDEWDQVSALAQDLNLSRAHLARRAIELATEQKERLRREPVAETYRWRG
jgi:hypothetical protein